MSTTVRQRLKRYNGTDFDVVHLETEVSCITDFPSYVTAGKKDGTTLGAKATAEGNEVEASGNYSHAEGNGTAATRLAQHVFGEYNRYDPSEWGSTIWRGKYVEMVGNGDDADNRSNARTLDWDGNETLAGYIAPKYIELYLEDGSPVTIKTNDDLKSLEVSSKLTISDGYDTAATIKAGTGVNSLIIGDIDNNYTYNDYSLAEGSRTQAGGKVSHAEGVLTRASGEGSHAEGSQTNANGLYSHAEGIATTTIGDSSHAEGAGTIAANSDQHVFGAYNIEDPSGNFKNEHGEYIEIVGNGTYDTRSNARTLDWNGNEVLAGALTIGGTSGTTLKKGTGTGSLVIGNVVDNTATKMYAVAEGNNTTASGESSHAEGLNTTASSIASHAECGGTTASGAASHAEGNNTIASGDHSHAEGGNTTASGYESHAEGYGTTASGSVSHAEGFNTTANHKSQHVFGEFNVLDTNAAAATKRGDYVEIVGNGSSNGARSNARTLDWDGNEVLAGKLTIGGTNGITLEVDANGNLKVTKGTKSATITLS